MGCLHYAVDRQHMFETLSDFANLPLLMLVATALSFLVLPLLNAYSRFNERQADRYAFRSIANGQALYLCHEQTGRAKPGGTFPCPLGGMAFSLPSSHFTAGGSGTGLG